MYRRFAPRYPTARRRSPTPSFRKPGDPGYSIRDKIRDYEKAGVDLKFAHKDGGGNIVNRTYLFIDPGGRFQGGSFLSPQAARKFLNPSTKQTAPAKTVSTDTSGPVTTDTSGPVTTDTSGPVDDNLSGDTTDPIALEHSLTGSAAKDYLGDIAGGDIDTSELEKRIRTQQAAGGLGYGGASAKQEATLVGRYKQGERLRASEQLASLSEAESKTTTQIGQLLGQSQQDAVSAATSQLTMPAQTYESILGGSMAGLNSIFGLGGLT